MAARQEAWEAHRDALWTRNGLIMAMALYQTHFLDAKPDVEDREFTIQIMLRLPRLDLSLTGSLNAVVRMTDGIPGACSTAK